MYARVGLGVVFTRRLPAIATGGEFTSLPVYQSTSLTRTAAKLFWAPTSLLVTDNSRLTRPSRALFAGHVLIAGSFAGHVQGPEQSPAGRPSRAQAAAAHRVAAVGFLARPPEHVGGARLGAAAADSLAGDASAKRSGGAATSVEAEPAGAQGRHTPTS